MTWRLGPVDQRTGGGRPSAAFAPAVAWPSGRGRLLSLLGLLAVVFLLLATPVPAASAADGCANAQFRTGWSAQLPDCRAYELVTPADKDANSYTWRLSDPGGQSFNMPAVSGDAVYTRISTLFANPHGMYESHIVNVRGPEGWKATNITPRACSKRALYGLTEGWFWGNRMSMDLTAALFRQGLTNDDGTDLGCDPNDHAGADVYRVDINGSVDWVSQNGQPKTDDVSATPVALSADGTHALFRTPEQYFPVDAGRSAGVGLYDRTGGQTVPVGVQSDGSLVNACGAQLAESATNPGITPWPISQDNRVIFFASGTNAATAGCRATDGGGQLYARIDANRTVKISASQLAVPAATTVPTFLGATPDGRKAYFASAEQLTADADTTGGLYEYDLGAVIDGSATTGTLRFLSPSDGGAAGVTRVARIVGDGEQVYFLATGVLAPGAPTTGRKVYRWIDGHVQLVASLQAASYAGSLDLSGLSVSPHGSKVVYVDQPSGEPYPQVYLVDADAPGSPTCVSCPAPGVAPTAAGTLVNTERVATPRQFGDNPLVTDDGRVFFGSPERLAAGDTDDYYDVYEYRAGRRYLVTPGTDKTHATLVGASADGRDVFFYTDSSLVAKDFDNGDLDMYTARIGGGFPAPPAAIPCAADECQPQGPAPVLAAPGSVGFVAPFAPVAPAPAKPQERAKKVSVKRPKTVRGKTKVRLSVRAPEAGRIRVSGSGLKRAKKTAKKAKTYRVTVKLSKRSKRILKRRHRVQVRATVRFTPKQGKTSRVRVHVTFKTKRHHGKASRRSHDGARRSVGKDGR